MPASTVWWSKAGRAAGSRTRRDVASMVLLPLVASRTNVPIVAAGGIVDGASMAAAFALGAEGVQMGTRMVSAAESPVHDNWKRAIVDAAETDTVFLNRHSRPGLRALRTELTTRLEREEAVDLGSALGRAMDLYFGGDMEAAVPLSGQAVGRIDEVRPVADIIDDCVAEFDDTIERLCAHRR